MDEGVHQGGSNGDGQDEGEEEDDDEEDDEEDEDEEDALNPAEPYGLSFDFYRCMAYGNLNRIPNELLLKKGRYLGRAFEPFATPQEIFSKGAGRLDLSDEELKELRQKDILCVIFLDQCRPRPADSHHHSAAVSVEAIRTVFRVDARLYRRIIKAEFREQNHIFDLVSRLSSYVASDPHMPLSVETWTEAGSQR